MDKYRYKASVFVNYIEQNPQIFQNKEFSNLESAKNLLDLNAALYLVVENNSGEIFGAINLEIAERSFYVRARTNYEGISKGENVYSIVLPVSLDKMPVGKIYVGFDSGDDSNKLFQNKLLTTLFCISILFAGIFFTYILSSISFRPLTKIIRRLDNIAVAKPQDKNDYSHKDQLGILADRVDIVLSELEKSSSEVESLNKKLAQYI